MTRGPDVVFSVAGHDDPDRQLALKVTNFLAGIPISQALAVYSLAMTQSFRDLEKHQHRMMLNALSVACMQSWDIARASSEPQRPLCEDCFGAGTIGNELVLMAICETCGGSGAAPQ